MIATTGTPALEREPPVAAGVRILTLHTPKRVSGRGQNGRVATDSHLRRTPRGARRADGHPERLGARHPQVREPDLRRSPRPLRPHAGGVRVRRRHPLRPGGKAEGRMGSVRDGRRPEAGRRGHTRRRVHRGHRTGSEDASRAQRVPAAEVRGERVRHRTRQRRPAPPIPLPRPAAPVDPESAHPASPAVQGDSRFHGREPVPRSRNAATRQEHARRRPRLPRPESRCRSRRSCTSNC